MDKFKSIFSILAIVTITFLSSCNDTDVSPATDPSIDFVTKAGYITASRIVAPGDSVKIAWRATKSDKNLKTFTVTENGTNFSEFKNGTPFEIPGSKQNTYDDSIKFKVPTSANVGQQFKYEFKVTDLGGKSASQTITLTVANPINTFANKILGGQSNTTVGNFLATSTGIVLTLTNANASSSTVDFVYYFGNSNLATLAAPNNSDAQTIYNNPNTGIQNWATKNGTVFKRTSLSTSQFDAISNDADIISEASSGVTSSSISNLAVGNVIAFITASGKKGLVKVNDITSGDTGTIDVTVKVQN